MELTTSYQRLGEGYLGTDDYGAKLYIRIYAKYSEQDIPNNRTKVQYQARAYFDKNWTIFDRQSNGTVGGTGVTTKSFTKSTSYSGGETILETAEGWVTHEQDGTKSITTFATLNFPNWRWTSTASGEATLPNLHKSPSINNCVISSENNSQLTTLGLPTETIVQYLSNKTFTITANTYDDSTISNCSIYHNNILVGTSSSNNVIVDFSNVSELQTVVNEGINYVGLTVSVTDSLNGKSTLIFNFPVIKYTRPTIEMASTNIKRKTGDGTTLTDNVAVLNFVGTCYKGNDIIGNANNPQVQYKIWNTIEPSYSNVTSTTSANVIVSDFIINNISYLQSWNYKIKTNDTFLNIDDVPYVKIDKVSTGVSVFSEYKDRVDFIAITIGGTPIIENDNNVDGNYVKYADGTLICYKTITDTVAMTSPWGVLYEGSMDLGNWPEEFISSPHVQITNASASGAMIESYDTQPTTTSAGIVYLTRATSLTVNVTLNVMAIGKWK